MTPHYMRAFTLQEFFISGGDGLPRGVVENQVARVRQVIKLHGYEVSCFAIWFICSSIEERITIPSNFVIKGLYVPLVGYLFRPLIIDKNKAF